MRVRAEIAAAGLVSMLALVPVQAADLFDRQPRTMGSAIVQEETDLAPLPRFFPREGSEAGPVMAARPRRIAQSCRPRRVLIPTDAPDDPSYVGSTYGLGKPSVYGFVPPLGIDDPFGRSVLPYCR